MHKVIFLTFSFFVVSSVEATTFDDIDYIRLQFELGVSLPDGSGVRVAQVEAPDDTTTPAWIPDVSYFSFAGKIFNEISLGSIGFSSHANVVGWRFYALDWSTAPGISQIDLYEANDWVGVGFLNTGAAVGPKPKTIAASIGSSAARVANHSWIADGAGWNSEMLRRIDYLVEVDDFIQVVAMVASPSTTHLLSDSFNAIVAGLSKGSSYGTSTVDGTYVANRTRPDIVAPENVVSTATPRIASAAALLVGHAHSNPTLSTDPSIVSTTNTNGDTIYNAERSETIKAILMAGADRNTSGNTNVAIDITNYRVAVANQTDNGLDKRFGAGQLNIYNSYHILNAGEQNSVEDQPISSGVIGVYGFDYDPSFGGLNASNSTGTYNFSTSAITGQKIKATLAWNLDVLTTSTDNLYDLDLQLIDVTGGNTVVASSTSTINNTENLWFDLSGSHDYQIKVVAGSGQGAFEWDYALAWEIIVPGITIVETGGSTITDETGATDSLAIILDSQPEADVIVNVSSSNTGEAIVSPNTLTFTSSNWHNPRTITVTGVDDTSDDGDTGYSINFTASSADSNYNNIAVSSIIATNKDDEATFSFADQLDVALNTLIYSNTYAITGLINATTISITGGEYSINGAVYTSTPGTVNNGDDVTLRAISSSTGLTITDAVVTIGSISDTFSVTTEIDTDGDGIGNTLDIDDDNDGLTDVDELVLGTNPLLADTDSDGLTDMYEVTLTTNPLLVDTDNDGFTDGEEVSAGSNPLDINSLPIFSDADINNDGLVDMADVILARQLVMGNAAMTSEYLAHGDVAPLIGGIPSPDGLFTLGDLVVMQRKVIGEINF